MSGPLRDGRRATRSITTPVLVRYRTPPMTNTVGKTKDMHVWRCTCGKTGRERYEAPAWRALNLHVECAHPLQARGLRAAHIYLDKKAAA